MKIRGFEILVWTQLGSLGRVLNFRMEYGNSPIRDCKSREKQLQEFDELGVEYTVHPIIL
jgi:hypothetical protein